MKKFLAIYMGSNKSFATEQWNSLSSADRQEKEREGMKAWMNWGEKNHGFIQDAGNPLGKTKRINRQGIEDIKNAMTGYTIIEAESHEEAAKLFLNHPHFSIFPGDSVEIMECLPLPKI